MKCRKNAFIDCRALNADEQETGRVVVGAQKCWPQFTADREGHFSKGGHGQMGKGNGKVGSWFGGKHRGGTVIPAPRAIGYNPIVPLVFPARCSSQFLSNLEPVPRVLLPAYTPRA